jgi:polygalacturonase
MSGDVRNVFMHDCEFEGTDRAIRIKSRRDRGGVVEKIYARDIKVRDMVREVIIINMDYSADKSASSNQKAPVFRDMCFERITADGAPVAIRITGDSDSPIENIRFRDMKLTSNQGVIAKSVKDLHFENIHLNAAKGPVFELENATGVIIENVTSDRNPEIFLKLEGTNSRGIEIQSCPSARGRILLGEGIKAESVGIK